MLTPADILAALLDIAEHCERRDFESEKESDMYGFRSPIPAAEAFGRHEAYLDAAQRINQLIARIDA